MLGTLRTRPRVDVFGFAINVNGLGVLLSRLEHH